MQGTSEASRACWAGIGWVRLDKPDNTRLRLSGNLSWAFSKGWTVLIGFVQGMVG